jgi:ATP-dependent Clp protease protease subunit
MERIEQDLERDNFMSADAALEYGLIDTVLEKRQQMRDSDDS